MKNANELRDIANGTLIKRETNRITEIIINLAEERLINTVNTYGNLSSEINIGKTALQYHKMVSDIIDDGRLDEIAIRRYFTIFGISVGFKDIGMIEDKTLVLSLQS